MRDRRKVSDHLVAAKLCVDIAAKECSQEKDRKVHRDIASYHCVQAFKECFRHRDSLSERERAFTVALDICLGYPPANDPEALKGLARVIGDFAARIAAGRLPDEEINVLEEILMEDYGFDLCAPFSKDRLP